MPRASLRHIRTQNETSRGHPTQRTCVKVDVEDGVTWGTLHRPEKRNAMNPTLNAEMREVLDALDAEPEAAVVVLDRGRGGLLVVLTGAGEAFSAGMDLKEYFREVDAQPDYVQRRVRRDNSTNRSFSIGKGGRSVGVQQFLDQKSILRPGLQTYTRESGRRRASAGRPAPGLTWALQRRRHRPPGGDSTGRRALPGA